MRPLTLMLFSSLLAGCSSPPAVDIPAPASTETSISQAPSVARVVDHNLRQLSGTLLTPPADSLVELAVLLVDSRGQPRQLLDSLSLNGTGQALPFTLNISMSPVPAALRLQLRARVSVSGQLVQRLPGRFIQPELDGQLGALALVPAP